MKKILIIILFLLVVFTPVEAKSLINTIATIQNDFNPYVEIPKFIDFKLHEDVIIPDVIEIPKNSSINAEVLKFQRELRWHKSAYAVIKILNYTEENEKKPIDISDKEIYLAIKKYKRFDGREAGMVAGEIIGSSTASFFLPGVDIVYFFAKGAIVRDMHPNWFKSGVSKVYDNSILWFIEKGKQIELDANDEIKLKHIENEKLENIFKKIDKRKSKDDKKLAKKEIKNQKKEEKRIENEKKEAEKIEKMNSYEKEEYLAEKRYKEEEKKIKELNREAKYLAWQEKRKEIEEQRTEELKEHAIKKQQKKLEKQKKKEEKELKKQKAKENED